MPIMTQCHNHPKNVMARRLQDIGATVFMCQPKASANGGIRIQTVIQRHVSKSHYMGGGVEFEGARAYRGGGSVQ